MSYASAVTLYHNFQQQELLKRWESDLKQAGLEAALREKALLVTENNANGEFPAAAKAAAVAVSKGRAERPLITVLGQDPAQVESRMNEEAWQKIASLHRIDTKLDRQTVNLMRQENPNALQAGALAGSKFIVEDPILKMVRNFEDSITFDTVRNEYLLHRQIHQWFIDGSALTDLDTLNERVYAELFLTPSSDPWLGLAPADAYTALDSGGLNWQPFTASRFAVPQPSAKINTKLNK